MIGGEGGGGGGGGGGRGGPIAGFNPFANGMPQLKKTGRGGGGIYVSPGNTMPPAKPGPSRSAPQPPQQVIFLS